MAEAHLTHSGKEKPALYRAPLLYHLSRFSSLVVWDSCVIFVYN